MGRERKGREGGEGRKGREGRGRGGKGVVPPRFNLVPHRFPWASYGPGQVVYLSVCVNCCALKKYTHKNLLVTVAFDMPGFRRPIFIVG
jgi:hypothetical protein